MTGFTSTTPIPMGIEAHMPIRLFRSIAVMVVLSLCCCQRNEQPHRPTESSATDEMFQKVTVGMNSNEVDQIVVGPYATLTGRFLSDEATRDRCLQASEAHYYYRNLPRTSFIIYFDRQNRVVCKSTTHSSIAY